MNKTIRISTDGFICKYTESKDAVVQVDEKDLKHIEEAVNIRRLEIIAEAT